MREHLVAQDARRVVYVLHPLTAEQAALHVVEVWQHGACVQRRELRAPSRPPLTYPLDLVRPLLRGTADVHIAFNNLVAARAVAARGARRVGQVAYWAVDFIPERFGSRTLTRLYDSVDAWVCDAVDVRFEVSETALSGRAARHGLGSGAAPAHVAPMGAWLDRVPRVPADGAARRRIVWIGHMVERQGVSRLIDALTLMAKRGVAFEAQLAGRGPEEPALRRQVERAGLAERVSFLGYIDDHRRLEAVLAGASVAVAPYVPDPASFTRYADPAKLKAYLAAGLPIVTTDVPPNAREIAERGGGEIVAYDAEAMAAALERGLVDADAWRRRHAAALALAADYDWGRIVGRALGALGWT